MDIARCPVLIADYFIAHSDVPFTPLQVIKLVYIAHGYSLAILGKPLVEEDVEAWRYGPVVPSVYHSAKKYRGNPIKELLYSGIPIDGERINSAKKFFKDLIPERQRVILDGVLEGYGGYTGLQLTNMTHSDDSPWKRYYKPQVLGQRIPDDAIKKHYLEMIRNVRT